VFDSLACICDGFLLASLCLWMGYLLASDCSTVSDYSGITSFFLVILVRILYLHEGFLRVVDSSLGVHTRSFRTGANWWRIAYMVHASFWGTSLQIYLLAPGRNCIRNTHTHNVTFFVFKRRFARCDCYTTSKLLDRDILDSSRLTLRGCQGVGRLVFREIYSFRQDIREECGPSCVFFVSTPWIPMKWSCIAISRIQNSTSRMPRVWQIAKYGLSEYGYHTADVGNLPTFDLPSVRCFSLSSAIC